MSTKEVNRLIAEFMGYGKRAGVEEFMFKNNQMPYHSSWDWLMPVVEKIHDECKLPEYTYGLKYFINLSIFCGIKVLLQAVVEFIKWYNGINEKK